MKFFVRLIVLVLPTALAIVTEGDEALCTLQREVKARHSRVSANPDFISEQMGRLKRHEDVETLKAMCPAADLTPWGVLMLSPALALLLFFAWILLRPNPPASPHLDALERQAYIEHGELVGETFLEMLYKKASDSRDRIALRTWSEAHGIERSLTYEELAQAVHAGAAVMAQIGVCRGDRVAFFCKGTLDFFVSLLSVQARGATPVLLNWRQSKENLQGMIEDSGSRFLVMGALQEERANLLSVLPTMKALILLDGDRPQVNCAVHNWSWSSGTNAGSPLDYKSTEASKLSRDAEALVLFTSGSTSRPKPVLHTYKTLIWTAEKSVYPENTTATLSFLPNFHVIMTVHNFLMALARGFCISVHAADATEAIGPRMLLKAAKELSPTVIDTVPFIMDEWSALSHQELQPLRSCKWVGSGGAPLSTAVARHLLEAGVPVREYYGQTEAPGIQLATVPGAGADELKIYMPPWNMAKIVLAGGGEEGELIIQGIENSAPGNLAKGELVAGSCKMEDGVGHHTGDVFRWTTTASGRNGLVHCMRTDDTTLLSTGEMFNPVPMEKSISTFAHGLDGLRGSQVAVLGKNRPAPILVVELPRGQKIQHSLVLEELQPGIDAANAVEVEYARIKPGHTLILSPEESPAVLPKTAKGNFIRTLSEQVLKELLDNVEISAKEAQASELLAKARAAGFKDVQDFLAAADTMALKEFGVDSLGVQVQEDETLRDLNQTCDNAKALIMVGVAVAHWYRDQLEPHLSPTASNVLFALSQVSSVQLQEGLAYQHFQATMWVFFCCLGISDGMHDGRERVVTFFNSRTSTTLIVLVLFKIARTIALVSNFAAYKMTGEGGYIEGSAWFVKVMVYYRLWVRIMQGFRFPRWLQIITAGVPMFLYAHAYEWQDETLLLTGPLWPWNLLLSPTEGLVPCSLCSLPGRICKTLAPCDCVRVAPGMCIINYEEKASYWRSEYNCFAFAYVLCYYYGQSALMWMSDVRKKVLAHVSDNPHSRKAHSVRVVVASCGLLASYGLFFILDGHHNCPVEQQFVCFWLQLALSFTLTVFISMAAIACPFHAKRIGASTLGIYLIHRSYIPSQLTTLAVRVSDRIGEELGTCATGTQVLQLLLLLAWPSAFFYTFGPLMQSACVVPASYIRGFLERSKPSNGSSEGL